MNTAPDIFAARAIGFIDATDLSPDTQSGSAAAATIIQKLCAAAQTPFGNAAAVCVWPSCLPVAAEALRGTGIGIATVVNFPRGEELPETVAQDTRRALASGATEIDVVIPYASFLSGDTAKTADVLAACKQACGAIMMKVILESGAFTDTTALRAAADMALSCGADMLKTSTGFYAPDGTAKGATVEAARVLLSAIKNSGRHAGLKVSGGVRTPQQAAQYIALAEDMMGPAWVTPQRFRIGASGLLHTLVAAAGDARGPDTSAGSLY